MWIKKVTSCRQRKLTYLGPFLSPKLPSSADNFLFSVPSFDLVCRVLIGGQHWTWCHDGHLTCKAYFSALPVNESQFWDRVEIPCSLKKCCLFFTFEFEVTEARTKASKGECGEANVEAMIESKAELTDCSNISTKSAITWRPRMAESGLKGTLTISDLRVSISLTRCLQQFITSSPSSLVSSWLLISLCTVRANCNIMMGFRRVQIPY